MREQRGLGISLLLLSPKDTSNPPFARLWNQVELFPLEKNMSRIKYQFLVLAILPCISCWGDVVNWPETRFNAKSPIKHGVPVFESASVDYQRAGKTVLKVAIGDPVVVSVAEKPEGFFQFPGIR